MRLYQYWDTPEPPPEVAEWIEGFRRGNPDMKHQLFDRDGASWFIRKRVGVREQRAFDAIAVPSMQSDYFRYCAVWALGGVYVDADFQCLAPLSTLLDQAPRSMILIWDHHLVGSLLMCRARFDPFIQACLQLSTANVEARWGRNAYMGAGPGVTNAVRLLADPSSQPYVDKGFDNELGRNWNFAELMERARATITVTPDLVSALAEMTLRHVTETEAWLGTVQPAYKNSERHWFGWRGPIYVEGPAQP